MGYFNSPCKMYHLILTPKKRHTLPLHVNGLGFDHPRRKRFFLSFFLVVLLCFVLFCFFTYYHFLTDLKYTDRQIASPLPAFISKIINPQVSNRYPFIFTLYTYLILIALEKWGASPCSPPGSAVSVTVVYSTHNKLSMN